MNTLKLFTLVKIYINTYICQALARYSSRSYCKGTGRVLKKRFLREAFGRCSGGLRAFSVPASALLRERFGCWSATLRDVPEAHSKPSRSVAEHVSNESRRGPEALPKTTRREAKENLRKGQICSGDARYLSGLFPATKGTIDSRLSYRECTESVPKRYWKGTKELLKRYQIATKQVQAFGSFLVDLRYKLGRAMEMPAKMQNTDLVIGAYGYCLKSEGLQMFCGTRVYKNEYLVVQKKTGVQKALKYFLVVAGYGKGYRMSLTCLLLMIVSMFSLSAQTPRKDSGADGLSDLVALKPGDKIPDAVWNQRLELNYFNGKKKIIKFAELKGKLIILDFWSTGCPACISGIPNLELIRDRFKGEIEILMINSKRNKDTPKRIENRFKKYKTDFNYVPTIATLLDDTLFTRLFNHNTLPTQAVINAKGEFLALLSGTAQLTDRNIKKILYENDNPLNSTGIYLNKIDGKRNFEVLITDTAGLSYSSSFSNYREHYIPIGPLWKAQKSNSLLIMGNLSLQNFMTYIFRDELEGFAWTDYVFDPRLGLDFKYRLFNTAKENTYWYQFYRNDSIAEAKAKEVARQDFMRYFDVSVQRKSDSISIYKVSFNKAIEKIKTKGQMMIIRRQEQDQELLYQNVPVDLFLRNLFYFFESPLYKTGKEAFRIDIAIPPGFIHWEEDQKITFLRNNGIILTPVREKREFAYIYSLK
ncbi:TlpA family protein disulfide reductase [Sphingobacterium detergens]|uniref:TlpA family protein disulfide reductase n=1 Tax=Sphingobacterium detergens TaxID=1145106 RepID=UPI003AABCF33